jgi:hypothetical protein
MPRHFAFSITAFATGLMISAVAGADEPQPQRGHFYFPPVKIAAPVYRPRAVVQQPAQQQSAVAERAVPAQPYATRVPATSAYSTAAVPYGYAVPSRPVSWGARYGVGAGYPASLFGQVTSPVNPQQTSPAPNQPQTPAYAQPNYGNGSMYLGTPSTTPVTGYSSIYGYAGRFYGPYYGYGPSYYSYGGMGGWGTPYNAGYYGSGCYMGNACCRASRRYCTPFGGMFMGCGGGCYIPTPPPCPTACAYVDPCGPVTGTPVPSVPTPSAAPQTYDTPLPSPSNATPPAPQPPGADEPATPIDKKVTPAPQAKNFPRIPNLPPDA